MSLITESRWPAASWMSRGIVGDVLLGQLPAPVLG